MFCVEARYCVITNVFGFKRCDSETRILFDLGLPSFDTLLYNRVVFFRAWCNCLNILVSCSTAGSI